MEQISMINLMDIMELIVQLSQKQKIIIATFYGYTNIVKLLLNMGANISENIYVQTAIDYCTKFKLL